MSAASEKTDVFRFMELRDPYALKEGILRQNYIHDDTIEIRNEAPSISAANILSKDSVSWVGKIVFEQVYCLPDTGNQERNVKRLIEHLLELLEPYTPQCSLSIENLPEVRPLLRAYRNETVSESASPGSGGRPAETFEERKMLVAKPLELNDLQLRPYIVIGDLYFLLPERIEHIKDLQLKSEIINSARVLRKAGNNFDLTKLLAELKVIFGGKQLYEVVFTGGIHSSQYKAAKRALFDTLYFLYIMRRRASINLQYVMDGLQVLHTLEALAIDQIVREIPTASHSFDPMLRKTVEVLFPELKMWNGIDSLDNFPLIPDKEKLVNYLSADPIIHMVFGRLHYAKLPFNDIKPIGKGDLKVVKQWLVGYVPSDIAHIENVLKGEVKNRKHRHFDKTDETTSFASDYKEASTKDTQTTGRLELKTEIDKIVKQDTSVGVNANVTYNYDKVVVANIGANFGYTRSGTDETKTSNNYVQETLAKAIDQVERTASEKRSITRIYETEETNLHKIENNKDGADHITGIYRWLDKKYNAQIFSYGCREMFEFVIPEPAAFWIESRLRAFESKLECPEFPTWPMEYPRKAELDWNPSDFNPLNPGVEKFKELRKKYDLAEFSFPPLNKTVPFINPETGQAFFSENQFEGEDVWYSKSYKVNLKSKGYKITRLFLDGGIFWRDTSVGAGWRDHSLFAIAIDGTTVFSADWGNRGYKPYLSPNDNYVDNPDDIRLNQDFRHYLLTEDEFYLVLSVQDGKRFDLLISAELTIDQALNEWWMKVYDKVRGIEQKALDKLNQEDELEYISKKSEYRNRRDALRATSLNDIVQGQSEAYNRDVILNELKKHCITFIAKEFAADGTSGFASIDCLEEQEVNFTFPKYKVKENLTENSVTCSFNDEDELQWANYPVINLKNSRAKGLHVQFLEQAFEWKQLAYIFHPYFYGKREKWVEMLDRVDSGDPTFTSFLQAGSARVLLAVTPGYENAVKHYIATREPWMGGPAPVLGDPLFIPLHEEIRKQQDNLYGGEPWGKPWPFTLPTSLVYLEKSGNVKEVFPVSEQP